MYEQKTTWLMSYSVTRRRRTRRYQCTVQAETHQKARKALLSFEAPGKVYTILRAECVVRMPK